MIALGQAKIRTLGRGSRKCRDNRPIPPDFSPTFVDDRSYDVLGSDVEHSASKRQYRGGVFFLKN